MYKFLVDSDRKIEKKKVLYKKLLYKFLIDLEIYISLAIKKVPLVGHNGKLCHTGIKIDL
jgi:hypothetical protein